MSASGTPSRSSAIIARKAQGPAPPDRRGGGVRRVGAVGCGVGVAACGTVAIGGAAAAAAASTSVAAAGVSASAVRYYERALEHGRLASDAWSAQLTGVALEMAYIISGRWNDERIAEETDWLIEPLMDELPLFRVLHQSLQCLRGYQRGDPDVSLGPVDQALIDNAPLDMGQEVAAVRLVQARGEGGLAALALEFAAAAVQERELPLAQSA